MPKRECSHRGEKRVVGTDAREDVEIFSLLRRAPRTVGILILEEKGHPTCDRNRDFAVVDRQGCSGCKLVGFALEYLFALICRLVPSAAPLQTLVGSLRPGVSPPGNKSVQERR